MALIKGVNSWGDLAEAEAYFADRLDVAAWEEASSVQKPQSLVTASAILDEQMWDGIAESTEQLGAFPRKGTYFDPRLGVQVPMSPTPRRGLVACFELAYHLLNNDGLLDDTGSVTQLELGSIVLEKIKAPSLIPAHVRRMIKPMLLNRGANTWWRAN
jgi:hypothetical protein